MKRKKENLPDIMISKVSFYGENLDFFFLAASVTRADTLKKPIRKRRTIDIVRLKPNRFI